MRVICPSPNTTTNEMSEYDYIGLIDVHRNNEIDKCDEDNDIDNSNYDNNEANLRDLIAATGLVILLKLDWNRRFFSPCDL